MHNRLLDSMFSLPQYQNSDAWMLPVLAVLLTLGAAIVWRSWRRKSLLDMPKIPGPPISKVPLLGNLLSLARPDWHRQVLQWADQYGGIYRLRGLWYDGLVVSDPATVATICGRGEGALDKAALLYIPINQMCSPRGHSNLLTSNADPTWRAVRKAVAAAFSVNNMRKKYPVVQKVGRSMVQQLEELSYKAASEQKPPIQVDVDQMALRVTLDVIGLAGFGHDFKCLSQGPLTQPAPSEHLLRVLPRCFTEVMWRMMNPLRGLLPDRFQRGRKGEDSFLSFQSEMRVLLRECLQRKECPAADDMSISAQLWRAYYEQPQVGIPHIIPAYPPDDGTKEYEQTAGHLLPNPPNNMQRIGLRLRELWRAVTGYNSAVVSRSAGAGNGKEMLITPERILSEIGILFIEGFETTGHTVGWTLLNIATVPGVQDNVAKELASLGLLATPTHDGKPAVLPEVQLCHLPQLVYLTACVKEAMRMLPVVSAMARTVSDKPTHVGPYLVPAHTPVAIPLYAIHNSRHNWEQPHAFRPDRWFKIPVEAYVVSSMPPLAEKPPAINNLHSNSAKHPTSATNWIANSIANDLANGNVTQSDAYVPKQDSSSMGYKRNDVAMPLDNAPEGAVELPNTTSTSNGNSIAEVHSSSHRNSEEDKSDGHASTHARNGSAICFMPFSEGPRNCVGQTLAKMEVITLLVQLLGSFRLELAPEMGGRDGVRSRESTHLTLQTKGTKGIQMILHPRWLPSKTDNNSCVAGNGGVSSNSTAAA